ncbi:MAG: glycosyltransferase family 2 protein, partial [Dehalococcoidales bacterium]|nr:glycosyltransferase family 2 protein [Dehalococcoidales bacterium]
MYSGNKIGVIVLAYDVAPFIQNVLEGLPQFVDRIYVVDDCSKDNTCEIVEKLNNPKVNLIRHETNQGPGAGLKSGFIQSLKDNIDSVVKVDGDGQMDPERIVDLIKPIIEGKADYTKGNRLADKKSLVRMPVFRKMGNYLLTWLTRICSGYWHISDSQNGFIAISKRALSLIDLNFCSYYGYLNDILARLNVYRLKVLDVTMPAIYGDEKSSIKYSRYIPRVSWILIKIFLWRLR